MVTYVIYDYQALGGKRYRDSVEVENNEMTRQRVFEKL